jgi:hypothetical protein
MPESRLRRLLQRADAYGLDPPCCYRRHRHHRTAAGKQPLAVPVEVKKMKRLILVVLSALCAAVFPLGVNPAWALTPDEIISLRNAGVSDQTIQLMIRQEQDAAAGKADDFAPRRETVDKDDKTVIIYSTGRPAASDQSQDKQTEKAWEMLRTIIIDNRRPPQ